MSTGGFLAMGGYAAYVWPAFAIAIAVLAWNVVAARRDLDSARAEALRRTTGSGRP